MALEIVNTGLEALADQISPGYSPVVKVVKDIAAGAVLIMAILRLRLQWCYLAAGRFYPYVRIFFVLLCRLCGCRL